MSVNHSKSKAPNNSSKKKTYVKKCWFCGNPNHFFWKCDKINTKKDKLKILKDKFPNNCTSCGFKHSSQQCSWMAECNDDTCTATNGKHKKLTCPKFLEPKAASVQQDNVVPKSIDILNID